MNLVSVIIIAAASFGAYRGYQIGFGRVVFPSLGIFIGIFVSALLLPLSLPQVVTVNDKLVVALAGTMFCALIGYYVGEIIGGKLNTLSLRLHLERINSWLGATFEVTVVLLLSWLLASAFSNVLAYDIGRQVQASSIVRQLNTVLPPAPDILSRLEKIVSPNGFPNVFIGNQPERALLNPDQKLTPAQIAAAEQSVVQIAGVGCGGLVEGSGFVIKNRSVVTNAHVVAGVARPYVLDGGDRLAARVVFFDPRTDIAVLKVDSLTAPALGFDTSRIADGTTVAALGFPGGGPLSAADAVVLGQTTALGQNIYNRGSVTRSIYELAASIEPGNSGGPLITTDGKVAGVVFAKSVIQNSVGYALTATSVASELNAATTRDNAVSTGRCAAD